jgi:methanogenic corrinoid protein MtbC1
MVAEPPGTHLPQRDDLLARLLASLLDADQLGASRSVGRALGLGWTIDDVRFSLITPALCHVGVLWERGVIGVADEHLASSVSEWLLYDLAGRAQRAAPIGRRAIVGCSAGELHSLGARMLAHYLIEHGWSVLYLGASTPDQAWAQIVDARRPDVVLLSTATQPQLDQVPPTLTAVKQARPKCRTIVGGGAYRGLADPAERVGADVVELRAEALLDRLG